MPDAAGEPPPPPSMPTDIDLYCLECGYNLRSLSGDPRRCPECGYENPMGDRQLPEALVQQELGRMQVPPVVCTAAVVLVGLSVCGCFLTLAAWGLEMGSLLGLIPCLVLIVFPAIPAWIAGADAFKWSCSAKPGWSDALHQYHLYGLMVALVGGLPLAVLGLLLVPDRIQELRGDLERDPSFALNLMVTSVTFFTCTAALTFRWLYRRARKRAEPLQRDAAVMDARERLRNRLATNGRRWPIGRGPLDHE